MFPQGNISISDSIRISVSYAIIEKIEPKLCDQNNFSYEILTILSLSKVYAAIFQLEQFLLSKKI